MSAAYEEGKTEAFIRIKREIAKLYITLNTGGSEQMQEYIKGYNDAVDLFAGIIPRSEGTQIRRNSNERTLGESKTRSL